MDQLLLILTSVLGVCHKRFVVSNARRQFGQGIINGRQGSVYLIDLASKRFNLLCLRAHLLYLAVRVLNLLLLITYSSQ